MDQQPLDPWLTGFLLALAAASFATWFALWDRRKRGPILPYEPRQPVPWAGVWALLPLLFVALAVVGTFAGQDRGQKDDLPSVTDLTFRITLGTMQQVVLVGVYFAVVVAVSGARRSDLGLPRSADDVARDVKIGVVAWLAALAPVYGMQTLLVLSLDEPSAHPLIELLQEEASPSLFALAFAAAVIAAPLCEEIAFRLLLQGWLEKWEDKGINNEARMTNDGANDEARMTNDECSEPPDSSFVICHSSFSEPPPRGLLGLPHGWLPILVSSLLFALAHFGYGPDPIPLFLLALILGYTYQRTHRILPCIVAHALFNGMTLLALWRVTTNAGP